MKKTLFALLMAAAGVASAQQGNDPQSLINMTLRSGHAIEGFLYGSPVIAVPIPNRPCPNVGIVFQEKRRQRDGQRIDNYSACRAKSRSKSTTSPRACPTTPSSSSSSRWPSAGRCATAPTGAT